MHKVKGFEIVGPYRLRIEFADGLVWTIDFRSILEGELYAPFADPRLRPTSSAAATERSMSSAAPVTAATRWATGLRGKNVAAYIVPDKRFLTLSSRDDWERLVSAKAGGARHKAAAVGVRARDVAHETGDAALVWTESLDHPGSMK